MRATCKDSHCTDQILGCMPEDALHPYLPFTVYRVPMKDHTGLTSRLILLDTYHIWPSYCTVHLGFFKINGKTCGKICICLPRLHFKEKINKEPIWYLCNFFLNFFIKSYVVGTHLNCIDKSMQFKWVPITFAFIKKKTKSTLAVI